MSDLSYEPETPTINKMCQLLDEADSVYARLSAIDLDKLKTEFTAKAEFVSNNLSDERIEEFCQLFTRLQDLIADLNPCDKDHHMSMIEETAYNMLDDNGIEILDLS